MPHSPSEFTNRTGFLSGYHKSIIAGRTVGCKPPLDRNLDPRHRLGTQFLQSRATVFPLAFQLHSYMMLLMSSAHHSPPLSIHLRSQSRRGIARVLVSDATRRERSTSGGCCAGTETERAGRLSVVHPFLQFILFLEVRLLFCA